MCQGLLRSGRRILSVWPPRQNGYAGAAMEARVSTQVRQRRWPRRLRRAGLTVLAVAAAVTLVVVVAFYVSYWPATWLLRGLPAFVGEDPAAGPAPAAQGADR